VRYLPKLRRIPVLIGLASAGVMVTSTLAAAAPAAADLPKVPTPPYIHAIFPLGGCRVAMQILLSTDDSTPQNQIRYQVFSNGVPIPGDLVLARVNYPAPGYGALGATVQPAPTPQRFTLEAVDLEGDHSGMSAGLSRTIPNCGGGY
jgi:hypothetical protein